MFFLLHLPKHLPLSPQLSLSLSFSLSVELSSEGGDSGDKGEYNSRSGDKEVVGGRRRRGLVYCVKR